jgi:peptidoglycan DL-endopeptidase LytF
MGNFEKLSVLVIVVIIVMILVVALYTWTDNPDASATAGDATTTTSTVASGAAMNDPLPPAAFPPAPPSGVRTPIATIPGPGVPVTPPATVRNPLTGDGAVPPVPTPATPEMARVETPAEPRVHVVASGDNLTKIAKKYFNSTGQRYIDAIAAANPGLEPSRLRVNQKLQIPGDVPAATRSSSDGSGNLALVRDPSAPSGSGPKAGSVYTVRRGDKLPDIARRAYGSSENWHLIWLENFTTIRDPDEVASGTKLKIPHVN